MYVLGSLQNTNRYHRSFFFPGDHHQKANLPLDKSDPLDKKHVQSRSYRVLKRGCPRGEGSWGTLRIPREDWGTLGNIRED